MSQVIEAREQAEFPRVSPSAGGLWAIVLAGGEGTRLRPLVRRIYGEERPKQFAALVGSRSLLRQTLDRTALAIAPERTVVVTSGHHARYFASEFGQMQSPRVLVQPLDRGTAAGVLLPAHWIAWRDPEAIAVVLPSDHFVPDESAFMAHVLAVSDAARHQSEGIILFGARPTGPEPGYGWIEPGVSLEWGTSMPLWQVRSFWEKPSGKTALACFQKGCLWNTFVMVARASALIEAGRCFLPELHGVLSSIAPAAGTEEEQAAIEAAYSLAPAANFSDAILGCSPPSLAVSELPALIWSDWGTPERVFESLQKAGITPDWSLARPA